MYKFLLCFGILICLNSCGGGSSNPAKKYEAPLVMEYNGQDVMKSDVHVIGLATFTLLNNSSDSLLIKEINLINNSVDKIDISQTTCIGELTPGAKCILAVNLLNVYTSKEQVKVSFITNEGQKIIPINMWNYNYTTPYLSLTVESDFKSFHDNVYDFINNNVLNNPSGLVRFTLHNDGDSPIFLESINLVTPDKYNNFSESGNLCGGTILRRQTCQFAVFYGDIGASDRHGYDNPLMESLIFNYSGGSYVKSYRNSTMIPEVLAKFNCHDAGVCTLYFNTAISPGHKIIINKFSFQSDPSKNDINITPTESMGCIEGINLNQQVSCSYNIKANKIPVDYSSYITMNYRYYIDDNIYEENNVSTKDFISLHILNLLFNGGMTDTIPSLCAAQGGEKTNFWYAGEVSLGAYHSTNNYHIKNIVFTPSSTNYEIYATKTLINQSQAILKDGCTGTTLNGNLCYMRLQAGCQGYGPAGTISYTYTVNNNPTEFVHTQILNDITKPFVEIGAGEGYNFKVIWREGQSVPPQPIHINIPPTNLAGFNLSFSNWYLASSYAVISDNYNLYKEQGIPSCFGNLGLDPTDNFWVTGKGPYCGIGLDFSKIPPGTSIPITLSVGNRAQYKLNFIFDINNSK